jgi:diketogulonate reductase-like aldo/keto reductase
VELRKYCKKYGVVLQAYSSLGSSGDGKRSSGGVGGGGVGGGGVSVALLRHPEVLKVAAALTAAAVTTVAGRAAASTARAERETGGAATGAAAEAGAGAGAGTGKSEDAFGDQADGGDSSEDDAVRLTDSSEGAVTTAQVLIRWAVQQGVPSIPKSVRPQRIRENARVFGFELNEAHMDALAELDEGRHFCWDPTPIQ